MQREYRRHLPHQIPEGVPIFLTWNLKGALPREVLDRLEHERERLQREPPRPGESPRQRSLRHGKLIFAKADEFLDGAGVGQPFQADATRAVRLESLTYCQPDAPLHLRDPACAKIVEDSILFGASDRYQLFAWCVMANHVHVLLTPIWELAKVTQGIKGYTAWKIHRLKRTVGQPFQADRDVAQPFQADRAKHVRLESLTYWQDESFDHWARDEEELLRIIYYIENNPVKAGLCSDPKDWPWSSARLRDRWPVGQAFQPDIWEKHTTSAWKA